MRVVVAMVTHNGERYLDAQLRSIAEQSTLPDTILIFDDASSDGTCSIIEGFAELPIRLVRGAARTSAHGLQARIGQNFSEVLVAARELHPDVIILADQDDVWMPDRVEHQLRRLSAQPEVLMTAANASLIDSEGMSIVGSLRDSFPVPQRWAGATAADRLDIALSTPVATGACMALRAELVELATPVPDGWLHDRWLSLVAAARGQLDLDSHEVVRYRVHAAQNTGLNGATKGDRRTLLANYLRSPVRLAARIRQVSQLGHIAAPGLRGSLRLRHLLRIYLLPNRWGLR